MLRHTSRLPLDFWRRQGSITLQSMLFSSKVKGKRTKVPQKPLDFDVSYDIASDVNVDMELVQHLEKLSLVDFANKEGLIRLQAAISLADQLSQVDVEDVEPLYSVLEDRSLPLADDEVLIGNMNEEILGCAKETLEDYFVVPPGNIDYIPEREYVSKLKDKGGKT
ncbi:glutamyl-tRNA(Gln) amidotransferase subunit C, mitochondrial [Palaemon carinicauda]|uniref:glutamyl-tRNA(Gln) amidotransferase subunit C, mitochondrial n=1 Tax=Palaemon carinicauda TaxID=392227 RepID=UPI0035B67EDF